mgnify:CR=1 FL=1
MEEGHLPTIEYLVGKGADMEAEDKDVSDVISLMRNDTLKISQCDFYQCGRTPLLHAALSGYLAMLEHLVENGADMEATDEVCDIIQLYRC